MLESYLYLILSLLVLGVCLMVVLVVVLLAILVEEGEGGGVDAKCQLLNIVEGYEKKTRTTRIHIYSSKTTIAIVLLFSSLITTFDAHLLETNTNADNVSILNCPTRAQHINTRN